MPRYPRRSSSSDSFDTCDPPREDSLSLSFLDVLSCGLGAAIYLFLIFSVMPHIGQAGAGTSAKSEALGHDANAGTVGAKFDNWHDVVANAPITIIVSVKKRSDDAAVASPPVLEDAISFRGLPRGARSYHKGTPDSTLQDWVVMLEQGIRPADKEIECIVTRENTMSDRDCAVRVLVGGGPQQRESLTLKTDNDQERVLFRLVLTDELWIKPTLVPKEPKVPQ